MDPSIRERLGLRAPARPLTRARAERVLAARSLMFVFLVGALVAAVALGSPVGDQIDGLRISITGSCAALIAVILLVGYDRLPRWALSVCLLCGSMLIEWAVYAAQDPKSPFLLFYLWVAFYAFYFLNRAQAAMQAAFVGVAYGVVVALTNEPLKGQIIRWLVFMIALVVAGLLVRMMRERIDTLLRSLDAANKTDMLTGLLDENGFTQILEKEKERAGRNGHRMALAIGELDGD